MYRVIVLDIKTRSHLSALSPVLDDISKIGPISLEVIRSDARREPCTPVVPYHLAVRRRGNGRKEAPIVKIWVLPCDRVKLLISLVIVRQNISASFSHSHRPGIDKPYRLTNLRTSSSFIYSVEFPYLSLGYSDSKFLSVPRMESYKALSVSRARVIRRFSVYLAIGRA